MRGRRDGDSMVVGFVTTYATSAYHCAFESRSGKVYSHYVITFVSDLQLVGGILRVLWFPPQIIQTTAIYNRNTAESGVKHLIPNHSPTFAMAKQVHDLFELKL